MHWWFYVTAGAFGLYAFVKLTYLFSLLLGSRKPKLSKGRELTVMLAARNEEANILACLEALARQNYPVDGLEILVGDDGSEDRTGEIVREFVKTHPNFQYHRIEEQLPGIHGKQNVLAQLARKASGELLLTTDADIRVAPNWAAALSGAIEGKTVMASGPTLVMGRSLLAKMQSLDWLMGMSINKAHEVLGVPVTASGNNSATLAKAYFEVGGYEAIPFSITEDYKLFQVLCEQGPGDFRMLFHPDAYASSEPERSLSDLFRQRKRWFAAGSDLAWYNIMALLFNSSVLPVLAVALFLLPWKICLAFYLLKVCSDFAFLVVSSLLLRKPGLLLWFLPYEIYYNLIAVLGPINQILPGKVNWKGREY